MKPKATTSTEPPPVGVRRRFRAFWGTLRFCRRCALIAFALLLLVFLVLNQLGLPDFAKGPLLDQLRSRGADLDFSRMRVRLGRGIVVEQVNLRRTGEVVGEQVFVTQLQLKLRWSDLVSFRVPTITAVTVHGGRLKIPFETGDGQRPYVFSVEEVDGRLKFDSETHWILDRFDAKCHGGRLNLTGDVVLKPPGSSTNRTGSDSAWRPVVFQIGRTLEAMKFRGTPLLDVSAHVDLVHPSDSTGRIQLTADGVESGAMLSESIRLDGSLGAVPESERTAMSAMRAEVHLALTGVRAPQGDARSFALTAQADLTRDRLEPVKAHWDLKLARPNTRWAGARLLEAKGDFRPMDGTTNRFLHHAVVSASGLTNQWGALGEVRFEARVPDQLHVIPDVSQPMSLEWSVSANQGRGSGGVVEHAEVSGVVRHEARTTEVNPPLAWSLNRLADWTWDASLKSRGISHSKVQVDSVALETRWRDGVLTVTNLSVGAYDGRARVNLQVDARTREVRARAETLLDLKALAPALGPETERWLGQFGWSHEQPPAAQAEALLRLPAGTNGPVNWGEELISNLQLAGLATVTNGSYRGVAAKFASVPFSHTNRVWRVLGARVERPEGQVEFDFTEWSAVRDYHFRLKTSVDPAGVSSLFGASAAEALKQNARFTEPPKVELDLWGRWREPERTGVAGRISARRFHVRGQDVDEFDAAYVGFTNGWLRVKDARVRQGEAKAILPLVEFDIPGRRLYFTNALSTLSPRNVTRAIGPKTARALEPFEFAVNPTVVVNGVIPTQDDVDEADVRFETLADRFHWWRLSATNLAATVWWRGQSLVVTNLDSGFHGGRLTGNLVVDFTEPGDSVFRFDSVVSEVQLKSLLAEVVSATNRIEGIIGGRLTVREAHSRTNGPWQGSGIARMRDGFLWDLPLFGGLSSTLDRIAPGVAQSRFSSGSATFTITNRTLRSQDLEFRSPSMRLLATGTVDFDSRLEALMHAEILRDVPVLGPLVSLALSPVSRLFEYDVRGTLGKPVMSMAHVPGVLMAPLRPIQTFKSLLPGDTNKPAGTESPPDPKASPPSSPASNPAPGSTPTK